MTDQELKDLVASLAIDTQKLKIEVAKTGKQIAETDKQMKETAKQIAETDKQIIETNKQMKRTDEKLERMGIHLGNISNNQGDVAEEYFINSLKNRLQIGDIKFDVLLNGVELKTKKIRDEFDILLVNGNTLALIEVKYKVHPNLIEKLAKKIEHIRLMPSYKNYKIYAGVAGFKVPQDTIDLAKEMGYFVLQRRGDIIEEISDNLVAS